MTTELRTHKRPNVLVVLTDDQGLGDCSFYGNPVLKTPHMDRIATDGISFDQFHVTPMCAPTRGAFFSGMHPLRNMAVSTTDGRHSLLPELPCMPQAFADAGYRTALFGKWHLGRNWPNRPQDKGFQTLRGFYGFGTTGISCHWNSDYQDPWLVTETDEHYQAQGFCTDVFFNDAMQWIEEKEDDPFYAVIACNAPHFPFWAPHDLTEKYKDTDNPEFFAMMENLDDNLGRMDAFLNNRKLLDDTIVVFFTDNGPVGGKTTWTAGLRGSKGTPWEGGHRVPLFVRYPAGHIDGGHVVKGLCTVEDLYPSLLDICQVPTPAGADFDGINLAGAMRAEKAVPDRRLVVQIDRGSITPKSACIMWKDWRLLWSDSLYDVAADPHQDEQIAAQHSDIFYDMWSDYQEWFGPKLAPAEESLPEHIGSTYQELVTLDSSHARDGTDGQGCVRQAIGRKGVNLQGPWLLHAHRAGRYSFALRRWPQESGLALTEGCPIFETQCSGVPEPEGLALPITQALLDVDGFQLQAGIDAADPTAIHFEISLSEGRHEIRGLFADAHNKAICSAFYAEVRYQGDLAIA